MKKEWFVSPPDALWPILISVAVIYFFLIVYTRLAGKRSFSKMSSFDFAITVAIGSVLASTVLSKSVSLLQGAVGLGALYLIQMITARLRRYDVVEKIIDNSPLLLMEKKEVFHDNLKKAKVTLSDVKGKLREANVTHRDQVKAVIFESTGDISVLHEDVGEGEVEDWIMEGVER